MEYNIVYRTYTLHSTHTLTYSWKMNKKCSMEQAKSSEPFTALSQLDKWKIKWSKISTINDFVICVCFIN